MKQINIIGNILGATGYASHTRSLFNALRRVYSKMKISQEQLPQAWQTQVNSSEKEAIEAKPEPDDNRVDIYINLPHLNKPYLNFSKFFCQFVIWEGTTIPKFWLKNLSDPRIKYIFVASQHTKKAIYNTTKDAAIRKKIEIIPHGVDAGLFVPGKKRDDKFTFLMNKGWTDPINDRGGIQYGIKAFVEEFNKDENVRMLVKINKVYNPSFNVPAAVEQLGMTKPKEQRPELMVAEEFITTPQMISELYQQADVFVSSTRGEAFNLPVIEAMSCGIPAIVTDFGGQTDFVDSDCGWLVKYKLEKPADIMYEETMWATPDMKDLRAKMREAYNSKKLKLKSKISRDVAEHFSWDSTAKKVITLCTD
jgi:glycosyltransferase involved in cell wall biosynthesis